MYKLKIKGNFLLIIDNVTGLENVRHPLYDCSYSKFNQLDNDPIYRIEGLNNKFKFLNYKKNDYLFSELLDENGTAFNNEDDLELLLDDSLGKSNASVEGAIIEYRSLLGHGDYHDSAAANQVFDGTPKKLLINGLGVNTEKRGLPITGELYNTSTNKIIGVSLMDKGDLRITLTVSSATSNPTRIDVVLDIGTSTTAITIPIAYDSFTLKSGYPQKVQFNMPWYSANTFVANGGQLFISVNSGTATVSNRTLFISKDIAGSIE